MTVRLTLFGAPLVEIEGRTSALAFERRNQLLVLLALKRAWVGRAELAAMLWPDQESKLAFTNLRKSLFRLQSNPWARAIESEGSALRLQIDTDVAEFEAGLREERFADVLPLRAGELLTGYDDNANEAWSGWLGFERERLRSAWRDAVLKRVAGEVDAAEAIDLTNQLRTADPLDEIALRVHMEWLSRSGQVAQARDAYREFAERLQHDLGLAPGADLEALHDSLAKPMASTAPHPGRADEARDAEFVGRSVELRRITGLLSQDDCRLLVLIGPGGVGKTRLAQRAMRELSSQFSHGATFVPLEDLATPEDLLARLARETGVRLNPGTASLQQLVAEWRERQILLVLDNFEHLIAAAPTLEALLLACPQLRFIVTSRMRLALRMEWLFAVEGLPCPDIEDLDRLEAFDAARLFLRVATRADPTLVPSAEASSIVQICRLVEGLPLALELAAGWTRVLSCAAIAADLQHGMDLLRVEDPAQPARQASIEVVFDQSWRLLAPSERDALARLAVFRGGFAVDAAKAVAGASLPVLGALADKSLLRKDGTRLALHPLVQQMAALRLGEGEARASAEKTHAAFYQRLLTQLRRSIENGDREALRQIDIDFENCRAAWRSAIAHGDVALLSQCTAALAHFCDHQSRFGEGLVLLREAMAADAVRGDRACEALLLSFAAHLDYRLDRYSEAEAAATRALATARDLQQDETILQCLRVLGTCCLRRAQYAEARRYFTEALEASASSADPSNAADMLHNLGTVENSAGNYDEALRLATQSLARYQQLADHSGEASSLSMLGLMHMNKNEYEAGGARLKQALAVCERHGLVTLRGIALGNLVDYARKTGDFDSAQRYAAQALEFAQTAGYRALASGLKLDFVHFALERRDLKAARTELAAALSIAIAIGRPTLQVAGVAWFAEILAAQGEGDCACRALSFAIEHPSTHEHAQAEYRARLAQWSCAAPATTPMDGLGFDDLVHRIAAEADIDHAPLVAALRGAAVNR